MRLNVEIYSGIAAPPQLLQEINRLYQQETQGNVESDTETRLEQNAGASAANGLNTANASQTTRPGAATATQSFDDAPPCYEDAIASDIPPIAAPRPDYAPPAPTADDIMRGDDEKGG